MKALIQTTTTVVTTKDIDHHEDMVHMWGTMLGVASTHVKYSTCKVGIAHASTLSRLSNTRVELRYLREVESYTLLPSLELV